MKVIWNNIVVAEAENPILFEGEYYFPYDSTHLQYFAKNGETLSSEAKGVCDLYDIEVGGVTKKNGAWMCPNPTKEAETIIECFGFTKDIIAP